MAELERAVGIIDEIMTGPEFKDKLDTFAKKHMDTFSFDDENKLVYTEIYQEYQGMVEAHIEGKLVSSGVDLAAFFRDLPEYCELPEAHTRTGAILEVLRSLDNFEAFKEMILSMKKTMMQAEQAPVVDDYKASACSFVERSLELTKILDSAGDQDGWKKTADKGWIQTYRKKDPGGSPIDMTRCAARVNVPAQDFVEIFMNPYIKKDWDKEVGSCDVVSGDGFANDGYVVKTTAKIPFMKPREMLVRQQIKRNFPEEGAITGVVVGIDDPAHPPSKKALRCEFKLGNVIVRPETDKTCSITMFGHLNMHFPAFVWNHTSSGWLIRNVVKIEKYYKNGYKGIQETNGI